MEVGGNVSENNDKLNQNQGHQDTTMLFLTYWKLNEEMSVEDRQKAALKLTSSGLFPPEDVEIIRWVGTPDGWGIVLAEAESAEAIGETINLWRVAADGFFEETITAPAAPVQEAIENTQEMLDAFSSAD